MIRQPTKQAYSLFLNQMGTILKSTSPVDKKIESLRLLAMKEAPYHGNSFARTAASILINYPGTEPECIAACFEKAFQQRAEKPPFEKSNVSYSPFLASSDLVSVVNGGGLEHIKEFLEGKSEGHAFEAGGRGIFISPESSHLSQRAASYATRTPIAFFQTPCVMTAKIPGNKLSIVNHNGNYEAVILPENISAVSDIKYQILKPTDPYIFRAIAEQSMPAGGKLTRGVNGQVTVDYLGIIKDSITDDIDVSMKINTALSKIALGVVQGY